MYRSTLGSRVIKKRERRFWHLVPVLVGSAVIRARLAGKKTLGVAMLPTTGSFPVDSHEREGGDAGQDSQSRREDSQASTAYCQLLARRL